MLTLIALSCVLAVLVTSWDLGSPELLASIGALHLMARLWWEPRRGTEVATVPTASGNPAPSVP